MTIGENIKRKRVELGLTQKELGKRCGMADSAIRRYESNRANPKPETIFKIASGLGVESEELLKDVSPEERGMHVIHFNHIRIPDTYLKQTESEAEKTLKLLLLYEDVLNKYASLNKEGQEEAIKYMERLARLDEFCNRAIPQNEHDTKYLRMILEELKDEKNERFTDYTQEQKNKMIANVENKIEEQERHAVWLNSMSETVKEDTASQNGNAPKKKKNIIHCYSADSSTPEE